MNPYVFCGGSTSDPNTAGYWQVPLVKALADKNKDKLKLALVAMDIPISRQGIDNMEKLAGEMKIEVVDKQAVPPAAADVSGAAARIIANNANYVTSWAPVTTAVQMLGALATPGMERLVHPQSLRRGRGHAAPAEGSEARHEPGICLLGR